VKGSEQSETGRRKIIFKECDEENRYEKRDTLHSVFFRLLILLRDGKILMEKSNLTYKYVCTVLTVHSFGGVNLKLPIFYTQMENFLLYNRRFVSVYTHAVSYGFHLNRKSHSILPFL
jgi:hypothetical protein